MSGTGELPPLPDGVPEAPPHHIPYGPPLTLAMARTAVDAAIAEAGRRGWPIAAAIVTPAGVLVAFALMDDTQTASADIAIAKARTAAMFRRSTRVFAETMARGEANPAALHPVVVASPGGLPIVLDGRVVGGIGCSGVAGVQDEVAAQAGISALVR